ncbi:hypothetical protein ASZ90_000229 [hydrocarbon metagenome]|uniref:PABS domain-containing protein n=1 Tax=hydrocarbon metagenome TaxID=938273 RepID=A0A0W8G9S5_9ZZZZ
MTPAATPPRHEVSPLWMRASPWLLIFATGAAALVYQVAWQRYLSRLLGGDTPATAVVLAVFLGGLAVGYRLLGLVSSRGMDCVKIYALLEACIGLWGLAFPAIFAALSDWSAGFGLSYPAGLIVQGGFLAALLMGPPTICMGATVPLLTRAFSPSLEGATRVHARIYSVNTAGAVAGALAAGFFLVPELGLPGALATAAGINFLAAVFFLLAPARRLSGPDAAAKAAPAPGASALPGAPGLAPGRLHLAAFLSGFACMALENVLIRITALSMGASTHAFSLIVAAFILCLAAGSALAGQIRRPGPDALFRNQAAACVCLLAVYPTLDVWPYAAHVLRLAVPQDAAGMWLYFAAVFAGCVLVLFPAVACLGATPALLFHELKRELSQVGRHSGLILSVNTLGNLAGSLVGGILLYLFLDNGRVYLAAVLTLCLSALACVRPGQRHPAALGLGLAALAAVLLATRPLYDPHRFAMGAFRLDTPLAASLAGPDAFFREFLSQADILFTRDGPAGSVSVIRKPQAEPGIPADRAIMVNGKSDSAALGDAQTVRLIAHLPALFARSREHVLIIGLGTGVTAAEMTLYPDVVRLDVAEISPTVAQALPLFDEFTHGLRQDPRFRLILGDALRVLARADIPYDIIASEPSNPWVSGTEMLFTREFYLSAKERLRENGLFLQWMHIRDAGPEMVGMVVNTLVSVFPHCRVFLSQKNDLLLLASAGPLGPDDVRRAAAAWDSAPRAAASLAQAGLPSLDAVLLREIWNSSRDPRAFAAFGLQTMDRPRLHHMAGRDVFLGRNTPPRMLMQPGLAPCPDSFLLASRPSWPAFPGLPGDVAAFARAARDPALGILPQGESLALRAALAAPAGTAPPPGTGLRVDPALVRLVMGRDGEDPDAVLARAGLAGATDGERVAALWKMVRNSRDWVAPYPLDGLTRLARECAAGAEPGAAICARILQKMSLVADCGITASRASRD